MMVNCPKCSRAYKVDENRIPEAGLRMRCPQCSKVFRVTTRGRIRNADSSPPGTISSKGDASHQSAARPGKPGGVGARAGAGEELQPKDAPLGSELSKDAPLGSELSKDAPLGSELSKDAPLGSDLKSDIKLGSSRTALGMPAVQLSPARPPSSASKGLESDENKPIALGIGVVIDEGNQGDLAASANRRKEIEQEFRPRDSADFGDLKLDDFEDEIKSASVRMEVDLPAPAKAIRLSDPGVELDLSTTASRKGNVEESGEVDLPRPAGHQRRSSDFVELDLPGPASGSRMSSDFGEVDLPGPASGSRMSSDFGEVDLPGPASGSRMSSDFGELDFFESESNNTESLGYGEIELSAETGSSETVGAAIENIFGEPQGVPLDSAFGEGLDLPSPVTASRAGLGDPRGSVETLGPENLPRLGDTIALAPDNGAGNLTSSEEDRPHLSGTVRVHPSSRPEIEDPFRDVDLPAPTREPAQSVPLGLPSPIGSNSKGKQEKAARGVQLPPIGDDDDLISPADMLAMPSQRSAESAGIGSLYEKGGRPAAESFSNIDLSPLGAEGDPSRLPPLGAAQDWSAPSASSETGGSAHLSPPATADDPFGAVSLPQLASPEVSSAESNGNEQDIVEYFKETGDGLPPLGSTLGDEFAGIGIGSQNALDQFADIALADENSEAIKTIGDAGEGSRGSVNFGEVDLAPFADSEPRDLGSAPILEEGPGEFDAFPKRAEAAQRASTPYGGRGYEAQDGPLELDTSGVLADHAAREAQAFEIGANKPAQVFSGRRKLERQSRYTKIVLLSALGLVIVAGSLLSLTSYGPFGAYEIYQLLPNASADVILQQTDTSVTNSLKKDTAIGFRRAFDELSQSLRELKDDENLRLLGVYVHYLHQLRFGIDEKHDREATKLLGAINYKESKSPYATLALGAQHVRTGKTAEALRILAGQANNPHGLTLTVYAHLTSQSYEKALAAAKKLKAKENSNRASFLMAKALIAMGSLEEAEKELTSIVQKAVDHIDAHLKLIDVLLSRSPVQRDEVVRLAGYVIGNKNGGNVSQKAQAHALLGRLYLHEHDMAKAAMEFSRAEKLDASNVLMLIGQGEVALKNDDASKAALAFSKALAEDSSNLWARIGRVDAILRQGEIAEAKEILVGLVEKYAENARAHFLMGKVHGELHNHEEAEKEFKRAIELDKKYLEAYIALSQIYLKQGKDKDAMVILDEASEAVPGSSLINQTLADAQADRGDYAAAIVELSKAIDIDPDDPRSHFRMGQMYRKLGSLEDAERSFVEVEKRAPNYPGLSLERGLLMELAGNVVQALAAYRKALEASPNDIVLKIRLAAASILVKDLATAEKLLLEVQEKDPESSEIVFYLGEVYRLTGRTAEAATLLKTAASREPENPLYHLRYGMALMDAHDIKQASEEFKKAQKLDPGLAEVYVRMGSVQLSQGAARDAIETVDKALSLDPSIAEAYQIVAEAFEQLSDPRSAIAYYRRAVQAIPNNGELFFRLGLVELSLNGNKRAVGPFSQAVALGEKEERSPKWLSEALYRLGVSQAETGARSSAIATFEKYLKIAPENHLDRSEVLSYLERLKS